MDRWWLPQDTNDDPSERQIFLEDLLVLSDHLYGVGVPYTSRVSFMRTIFGAMKAEFMGNTVEETVSMYGESWHFEAVSGALETIYQSSAAVRPVVVKALQGLHAHRERRSGMGSFASHAALFRLQSTFQASVLLVRQGMHYEAQALLRLIIEQLAWAKRILEYEDESFLAIQPTQCITDLKRLFPDSGKLYGDLSSGAHLSPKTTGRYFSKNRGVFQISHAQGNWSLVDCVSLLKVADYFYVLCDFVVRTPDAPGLSLRYDPTSEIWSLRDDRPSLVPLTRYGPILQRVRAEFEGQGASSSEG
jgi:hypothetical protein